MQAPPGCARGYYSASGAVSTCELLAEPSAPPWQQTAVALQSGTAASERPVGSREALVSEIG